MNFKIIDRVKTNQATWSFYSDGSVIPVYNGYRETHASLYFSNNKLGWGYWKQIKLVIEGSQSGLNYGEEWYYMYRVPRNGNYPKHRGNCNKNTGLVVYVGIRNKHY